MHEELLPDFYRIEVPLPESPLRALNAYLVRGRPRNLLVDNGFNRPECLTALLTALAKIGVDLAETDFFLTHLHTDHTGLTSALLRSPACKVLASREDGERLNAAILNDSRWEEMFGSLALNGFPPAELGGLYLRHPGRVYAPPLQLRITTVAEGDSLNYGRYTFSVLEVPGHTPGHLALYESGSRSLISGDHILGGISPNITPWDGVADSLGDYLRSLDKTAALNPERTFPAHRAVIDDTRGRIAALRAHHAERLDETRALLAAHGPQSAYKVASGLTWSLRGRAWPDFQIQQKCFATGEALAHLLHLELTGGIRSGLEHGVKIFRLP